jgi:hypothetical protein
VRAVAWGGRVLVAGMNTAMASATAAGLSTGTVLAPGTGTRVDCAQSADHRQDGAFAGAHRLTISPERMRFRHPHRGVMETRPAAERPVGPSDQELIVHTPVPDTGAEQR